MDDPRELALEVLRLEKDLEIKNLQIALRAASQQISDREDKLRLVLTQVESLTSEFQILQQINKKPKDTQTPNVPNEDLLAGMTEAIDLLEVLRSQKSEMLEQLAASNAERVRISAKLNETATRWDDVRKKNDRDRLKTLQELDEVRRELEVCREESAAVQRLCYRRDASAVQVIKTVEAISSQTVARTLTLLAIKLSCPEDMEFIRLCLGWDAPDLRRAVSKKLLSSPGGATVALLFVDVLHVGFVSAAVVAIDVGLASLGVGRCEDKNRAAEAILACLRIGITLGVLKRVSASKSQVLLEFLKSLATSESARNSLAIMDDIRAIANRPEETMALLCQTADPIREAVETFCENNSVSPNHVRATGEGNLIMDEAWILFQLLACRVTVRASLEPNEGNEMIINRGVAELLGCDVEDVEGGGIVAKILSVAGGGNWFKMGGSEGRRGDLTFDYLEVAVMGVDAEAAIAKAAKLTAVITNSRLGQGMLSFEASNHWVEDLVEAPHENTDQLAKVDAERCDLQESVLRLTVELRDSQLELSTVSERLRASEARVFDLKGTTKRTEELADESQGAKAQISEYATALVEVRSALHREKQLAVNSAQRESNLAAEVSTLTRRLKDVVSQPKVHLEGGEAALWRIISHMRTEIERLSSERDEASANYCRALLASSDPPMREPIPDAPKAAVDLSAAWVKRSLDRLRQA